MKRTHHADLEHHAPAMRSKMTPQWGRTATARGTAISGTQQLVRLDFDHAEDVTLYLSGWIQQNGVVGDAAGSYLLSWGSGASFQRTIVVPVVGGVWHVSAPRVEVNVQLTSGGSTSVRQAVGVATLGRPTKHEQPLVDSGGAAGVQHVLPFFNPIFPVPPFTRRVTVNAFDIVAGTPTIEEQNRAGVVLVTRPAADYANGIEPDPRAWQLVAKGAGAEYNVLCSAEVWQ